MNDLTIFGLADSATGATGAIQSQAGFTLTAENANTDINISGGNGTGNGDLANSGLAEGNYSAQTAVTSSTKQEVGGADAGATTVNTTAGTAALAVAQAAASGVTIGTAGADTQVAVQAEFDAAGYDVTLGGFTQEDIAIASGEAKASEKRLADGDLVINDVAIAASSTLDDTASDTSAASSDAAASGISIAAAINKSTATTGVTATVNATEVTGGANGRSDGTTALNAGGSGTLATGETLELTVNGNSRL